ncbi:hypothetical protein [Kineococcus sp. SYSU DK001]|uniref:hypothetical protein n=1 Tax=Kineococcus sp. SYSU DK001 TaxID=3383122 RepID=UPI003D7CA692
MHRHTELTPVSLRSFLLLTVLVPLRELPHRVRPAVGEDVTWFLRDGPVPAELGPDVRRATVEPSPGAVPATGFPVRVRVVDRATTGPADDRRPVEGSAGLRDVHRAPKRFRTGPDRRDTHLLVDLAVRRA